MPGESRKRSFWAFMLMAAAGVGLLVAFGLCGAGFQTGFNQSYVTASILLFVISALALVVSLIAVIITVLKR